MAVRRLGGLGCLVAMAAVSAADVTEGAVEPRGRFADAVPPIRLEPAPLHDERIGFARVADDGVVAASGLRLRREPPTWPGALTLRAGAHWPTGVGAAVGFVLSRDLGGDGDFVGGGPAPVARLGAGSGGGSAAIGVGGVMGNVEGHVLLPLAGWRAELVLHRTWGETFGPVAPDQTFVGIELGVTVAFIHGAVGAARRIAGDGDGDRHILTAGIGLGF